MIEMRGKAVSDRIKEDIAESLDAVIKALGRKPRLEIIRVGTNEADASYGRSAIKKAEAFGMSAGLASFPSDISYESFEEHIRKKSSDEDVDGILVLRPLPPELLEAAERGLSPDKDLDGMTDINMSRILFSCKSDSMFPAIIAEDFHRPVTCRCHLAVWPYHPVS